MASISTLTRNGKVIGFQTNLGRGSDGKARRKFFKLHGDAVTYVESMEQDPVGTGIILEHEGELRFALKELKRLGVSMSEVLDFYEKNGAKRGNPTFAILVAEFLAVKKQVERKEKYLTGLEDKFNSFGSYIGKETRVGDISSTQITKYVYEVRKELSATTKTDYIRALSILFNFGIRKKQLAFNPTRSVERPMKKFKAPAVLSPADCSILLNRCLKRGWHDRLAVFVLTAFCGIRTEEACKLRWDNIDLKNKKVMVPAEVAKKARFRRNVIPPNAMKWLTKIYDARKTGPIIGSNAKRLLNVAVRFAHIGYTQNCLRHSFCSYALENGMPLADVVSMMGHAGSPAVIHSHYRNLVEPRQAKAWFAIQP